MCIICIDFEAGKLTRYEASRALSEFVQSGQIDLEHADTIWKKLTTETEEDPNVRG